MDEKDKIPYAVPYTAIIKKFNAGSLNQNLEKLKTCLTC